MTGALDGIRVIECSTWGFGPIGGMMLGDLGADVIKIESPTRPDAARFVQSVAGIPNMLPDGRSALFEAVNRNKRSLALDLKTERGQQIFRELIVDSDVFIENYRPGHLREVWTGLRGARGTESAADSRGDGGLRIQGRGGASAGARRGRAGARRVHVLDGRAGRPAELEHAGGSPT